MKIKIEEETIRLDHLLKFSGICTTGGQAKFQIQNGHVSLNGEQCTMRGKKIRRGDIVSMDDKTVEII